MRGAEIFSIGEWNGLKFDDADLDNIVRAFHEFELAGRVRLKFGHNDEQSMTDGLPALGWVSRVWKEGGKLLADFVNIPKTVYEAIRSGLYKFVSVELLKDVERNGRKSPWVLDAVALLGADPPAVSNLSDLQALATMADSGLRYAAKFQSQQPLVVSFSPSDGGISTNMTDSNQPDLSALTEKLTKFSDDVARLTAQNTELAATNANLASEIRRRDDESAATKVKTHRDAVKAKFEDAVKRQVIAPAARELFYRMARVDDDKAVLEVSMTDVDEYITVNGKKSDDRRSFTRAAGNDATDEGEGHADRVVAEKVADLMEQNENITYQQAMTRVFRKDPELGKRYIFQRG